MKIMFVSWAYPPNHTGIGSYTANMANSLSSYGHEVIIVTGKVTGLPEEESTSSGIILRCYDQEEIGSKKLGSRLLDIAEKYSIDLIECAEFLGEGAEMLRHDRRPPILIKAHNSGPVRAGRESEVHYSWQRWMQWAAILRNWAQYKNERYSLQHGDMLVTPSRRLMSELEKQGMKLPNVRTVLPNPITLPDSLPPFSESRQPTLLFVGRLAIGKGISYLPAIMKSLVRKTPDLKLIIAGGDSYARGIGSLQQWLTKKMKSLEKNIVFTGHLDHNKLSRLYSESWIVAVPSRWDTFPTVILEAMTHAKPVVASPQGGIPEMLARTLCKPVDPASDDFVNQISEMLESEALRRETGISMFNKAMEHYNPEVIAGQYTDFVTKYLKGH